MTIALEEISTITAKGQTTIPKSVRQALGVDYGGRIAFRVDQRGVTVSRADESEDPAIDEFLAFLADDIKKRPEAVKALSPELAARIAALTADMEVDPDAAIDGEVAL
jgi:antitoxin PrlF